MDKLKRGFTSRKLKKDKEEKDGVEPKEKKEKKDKKDKKSKDEGPITLTSVPSTPDEHSSGAVFGRDLGELLEIQGQEVPFIVQDAVTWLEENGTLVYHLLHQNQQMSQFLLTVCSDRNQRNWIISHICR